MKNLLAVWAMLSSIMLCAQADDKGTILNQYIVMLRPGHTLEQVLKEVPGLKTERCLSKRMNIWLLTTADGKASEQQLYRLYGNAHVKLAQYNHTFGQRALVPNDPYFNVQWNMLNDGTIAGGAIGADIEATEAWEINHENVTANGDSIVIAIIDAKFDLTHEDLNYFVNYNEVPGNGIDDDGNGYIDDTQGWNVLAGNSDLNTTNATAGNHSTHTAGIAAAIGNNGKGVAGVCWGAKILPINYGSTEEANVVAAYDYVREMRLLYNASFGTKGAFVVATNSSFGKDERQPSEFPIWCAMYDSMGDVGILSAGATANGNANIDIAGDIPTACPSRWLITVNNTNRADAHYSSGYGKTTIDIGAPGFGVMSTVVQSGYQNSTGTSMSTPHVAGAIGAMYAAACKGLLDAYTEYPDSIALLIKQYILEGAEWLPSLNNRTTTDGRLNLNRAIQNLQRYNCDSCNFSVGIQKIDIPCHGNTNGALMVDVSGNPGDYTYFWSTGSTGLEILNQPPGFYTVGVTDSTGCHRVWTEELHDPDTIKVNSISVESGDPSNIIVSASAGFGDLTYSLDGINYQSSIIFAVQDTGTYTVYIKSETGCVVQQQVSVIPTAIGESPEVQFSYNLYPNPATDVLNVALQMPIGTDMNVSIHNLLGQTLYANTQYFNAGVLNHTINTAALADGVYYLNISHNSKAVTRRFVIAR